MAMPDTTDEPLFVLVTKARTLADMLANMGMHQNAEVIRELVKRVVPVKLVPTRGKPVRLLDDPIAAPTDRKWCDQCQKLVATGCQSKFCKVQS